MSRPFRVALVYPPFGPAALPSLGLGLLSAGAKAAGFHCEVFYWNLDLVSCMPHASVDEQLTAYRALTERTWFPYNEWIFGRVAFGQALEEQDDRTLLALLSRAAASPLDQMPSTILTLRDAASTLVDTMVDRLQGFDVVGIATTFYQNIPALALARRVKDVHGSVVILGGANCDGEMGAALLELAPFVDAVLEGEADNSFPAFLKCVEHGEGHEVVPGLHWRDSDGLVRHGPGAIPLQSMDGLPPPDYDGWVSERGRTGLNSASPLVLALESSRGCWWGAKHHCTFCGLNANGMSYRRKEPARFLEEVRSVVTRHSPPFVFMTDNILSMDYVDTFLEWAASAGLGVDFFYEVKANLRRDQIRQLARAGVTAVQPGIESLSTPALSLMRKGVKAIQNVAFIKNCQELGVRPAYNLLVGFPGEDPRWYDEVVDQIPRLSHLQPPATVALVEFHRFSPYHNDPAAFGLELRPLEQYEALYPLDISGLSRIAYMFRPVGRREEDRIADSFTLVNAAVASWRAAFRSSGSLSIVSDHGDVVIIRDDRPRYGPRTTRLFGFAASIYRELADPHSLTYLLEYARVTIDARDDDLREDEVVAALIAYPGETIAFGAQEFRDDPLGALSLLSHAGLLFEERIDGRPVSWLALALPSSYAETPANWEMSGV